MAEIVASRAEVVDLKTSILTLIASKQLGTPQSQSTSWPLRTLEDLQAAEVSLKNIEKYKAEVININLSMC